MKKFSEFTRALVAKKKFFLFIGAVLLSVAMQATVVTETISLTSFEVYQDDGVPQGSFNSSTLEFSGIKAWGGGQIWYSDQNASALDAEDFTHIGFDLAEAAANKCAYWYNILTLMERVSNIRCWMQERPVSYWLLTADI